MLMCERLGEKKKKPTQEYWRTFFVFQNIWSKAPFITYISGILTVFALDDIFEIMVHLCSDAHGLPEGVCTDGQDHKLLHSKLVSSMWATIDHIECLWEVKGNNKTWQRKSGLFKKLSHLIWHSDAHWHWQDNFRVSRKVSDVTVQRDAFLCCSSFADSKGDSQDSICSKFGCLKEKKKASKFTSK